MKDSTALLAICAWLAENWLATYGAVVGSIALVISFIRLRHALVRDQVRLEISGTRIASEESIAKFAAESSKPPHARSHSIPLYQVTIRNVGNVSAHLEKVGLLTPDRKPRLATLKFFHVAMSTSMKDIEVDHTVIEAKSSRDYKVSLFRETPPFLAREYFAVDKTGRRWSCKGDHAGLLTRLWAAIGSRGNRLD